MTERNAAPTGPSRTYLPAILLLFVGSGCAALIYEVVWFQLLQLVIGSSSVSLGVLLGTFMGGMCLGSFLLPRRVSSAHHPLKVYAYLESGIGVMGLLLLFGMPLVNGIYVWIGGGHVAVRAIVAAVCLLPPTFLMGATLPAVARWVQTTPSGVAWLGYFYGGNIGGAVVGSLLAGFYLLRVYDMAFATYVAVALNATVAGLGLLLAKVTPYCGADGRGGSRAGGRGRADGLRRDRHFRLHRTGRAGALDAPAVSVVRRDRLHVFADSGRVPVRARHRQQHRRQHRAHDDATRAPRSAGVRCCSAAPSPGRPTC